MARCVPNAEYDRREEDGTLEEGMFKVITVTRPAITRAQLEAIARLRGTGMELVHASTERTPERLPSYVNLSWNEALGRFVLSVRARGSDLQQTHEMEPAELFAMCAVAMLHGQCEPVYDPRVLSVVDRLLSCVPEAEILESGVLEFPPAQSQSTLDLSTLDLSTLDLSTLDLSTLDLSDVTPEQLESLKLSPEAVGVLAIKDLTQLGDPQA